MGVCLYPCFMFTSYSKGLYSHILFQSAFFVDIKFSCLPQLLFWKDRVEINVTPSSSSTPLWSSAFETEMRVWKSGSSSFHACSTGFRQSESWCPAGTFTISTSPSKTPHPSKAKGIWKALTLADKLGNPRLQGRKVLRNSICSYFS